MFTGIVEETGEIVDVQADATGRRLRVSASFADELAPGQSVAVCGACLTVEDVVGRGREADGPDVFELFVAAETAERTYLGSVDEGDALNLERALPADGRLDGHFVQGHVDGTAAVTSIEQIGDDWTFSFSLPADLAPYVVEKGSVAVDGISLTVAAVEDGAFSVAVIPTTYDGTTLSAKTVGDPVHLEVDLVAKYVESLLEVH